MRLVNPAVRAVVGHQRHTILPHRSVDDGWISAEKTKHREEQQECDKHDGPKKKPLACRDRLHIRSSPSRVSCHSSTLAIIAAPERTTEDINNPWPSICNRSSQPIWCAQTSHPAVSAGARTSTAPRGGVPYFEGSDGRRAAGARWRAAEETGRRSGERDPHRLE